VSDAAIDETLRGLVRRGLQEAEVLRKQGRSRRLVLDLGSSSASFSQERAWAVRAGSRRSSFFAAGSGELPDARPGAAGSPWPEPAGRPFRLPEPEAAPPWSEPSDFAAPLLGESEGLRLLESLERELTAELPGSRLLHAALEDGASEGELANSRGQHVHFRRRLATLRLEAAGPGRPGVGAALYLAAREARRFHPKALARRLADRLSLVAGGAPPTHSGGGSGAAGALGATGAGDRDHPLLLAPPVAVALLAALLPLLVGPAAAARLAPLRDRRGRVGSEQLTIVDDGRLAGGALECPVDGEGVPCREAVLIEAGVFRQPLLAWWQADGAVPGIPAAGLARPAGARSHPSLPASRPAAGAGRPARRPPARLLPARSHRPCPLRRRRGPPHPARLRLRGRGRPGCRPHRRRLAVWLRRRLLQGRRRRRTRPLLPAARRHDRLADPPGQRPGAQRRP